VGLSASRCPVIEAFHVKHFEPHAHGSCENAWYSAVLYQHVPRETFIRLGARAERPALKRSGTKEQIVPRETFANLVTLDWSVDALERSRPHRNNMFHVEHPPRRLQPISSKHKQRGLPYPVFHVEHPPRPRAIIGVAGLYCPGATDSRSEFLRAQLFGLSARKTTQKGRSST
jgi:hypothetical protein